MSLISMDGTYLHGRIQITAGYSTNDQLFLFSFAIVEGEIIVLGGGSCFYYA